MSFRRQYLPAACMLLAFSFALRAQSTGSITGVITDVSKKSISQAVISIRSESGGSAKTIATDGDGKFLVESLAEGSYAIEVSAPSFVPSRRSGVKVSASQPVDVSMSLNVSELSQSITVEGSVTLAAEMAPSQNTLDAHSAHSEISPVYIQNFASPIADFTELLNNAPGTFSVNPNGVGLGDSKTYFRGFSDGQYTMQADGIPFNDTNTPTHHSWAFFPSQFIAGVDFDRSPGTASTIGPTNFGGTVNLLSRAVPYEPDIRATASYGSFNTRMLALDFDTGALGKRKKSSFTGNIHQLLSDGRQTYNYQKRVAGFGKYQYRLTERTTITAFGSVVDLWTNTPNLKGPSRAQVAAFGDNYLLSGDSNEPNYYGYNFYHVQTDFEHIGLASDLGHGWKAEGKIYTYRYWNKQYYNNPSVQSNGFFAPASSSITATSAVDKLNGYRKIGSTAAVSKQTRAAIFRTGMWYEWAYTDRYQIPSNPRTGANALLPNFHEHFITTSLQPYAEIEWQVTRALSFTGGVKVAQYGMFLNQYADNGKTVGNLGGLPRVYHEANYRAWMPAADLRYRLRRNWSLYAQFATGSVIPPSNVFDTKGALVAVAPKPTFTKTYQIGSVLKFNRWTLDADAYYSHFQNPYSSYADTATGESYFYATGPSNTKGIEAESNILLARGFSLYLNGTVGSAKYQEGKGIANGGLWVPTTPKNTEAIGLTYQKKNWDFGVFEKRVGTMYNDNSNIKGGAPINQAITINPFNVVNVFANYTVKGDSWLRGSKFRFAVNNILDDRSVVGVNPGTALNTPQPSDILTMLPGRSVSVTMTLGYAPKR